MHLLLLLPCIMLLKSGLAQLVNNQYFPSYRDPRLFLFFNKQNKIGMNKSLFNFLNKEIVCEAIISFNGPAGFIRGACIGYGECLAKKHIPINLCRGGKKLCCLALTRGGLFSTPFGYFLSTDPAESTRLVIRRPSIFFCQVKITMFILTLANPNTEGICSTESLTFSGHQGEDFTICGFNLVQHVYLRFQEGSDIVLDLNIVNPQAAWVMQIEQILCFNTENLAPPGCLQWYRNDVGIITSFGFGGDHENNTNTTQISNLNYNICFDDSPQNCQLLLGTSIFDGMTTEELKLLIGLPCLFDLPPPFEDGLPSPADIIGPLLPVPVPFGFAISGMDNVNDAPLLGNIQLDGNCTTDYLEMVNSDLLDIGLGLGVFLLNQTLSTNITVNVTAFSRVCGYLQDGWEGNEFVGESVYIRKVTKPFEINVVTNQAEAPTDVSNKGFRFLYNLRSCP